MSNIDNLIYKIIQDGENAASRIIEAAVKEGEDIVKNKKAEALKLGSKIIEKAKQEGKSKGERIISNMELEIRNSKLIAKHQVIDSVLRSALEKLANIDEDKYLELIRTFVNNMEFEGDLEVIVPEKFRNEVLIDFIEKLNSDLNFKEKNIHIYLGKGTRMINSGFIFIREGVEINNTFETVISSLRDELEWLVAESLFK